MSVSRYTHPRYTHPATHGALHTGTLQYCTYVVHRTLCTLRFALTLHTLALVLCMHMQRLSKRIYDVGPRGPADSVDPHALNP